ncbi:hypothetical protein HYH02_009710 [Chlamydomonas schloesseri]|uniref:Mitochondrial carrier protein n=1 Tax=Chlamydomonas schloesseri TaxID=2026947 RepID=A0A835W9S6_9CHLO|nr:hypothetical protein HYH02_009710 [Chlamydomonas schloesseri]|eukprot:KAG2442226.1 hypothetical protein HYH02_009710 [Chlamydomonas schloesseri]
MTLPIGLSLKPRLRLVSTCAVVGAGSLAVCAWSRCRSRQPNADRAPRVQLPAPAVDALAGALGEVAQILVLYPLDTVKVRCQASGENAAVVIRRLLKRGFNVALLKKLYAGALGAAACAIVVGAVHFASYEGSRKAILKWTTTSASGGCNSASGKGAAGGLGAGAAEGAAAADAAAASAMADGRTGAPVTAAAAADAAAAARAEQDDRFRRAAATFAAAAFAAVATALVESPVELFRHNAQAGLVQSNFMAEMVATVRREGPGGLYWGFLPHCFEAWPHDISELATYGFMRDFEATALRSPGSPHHAWMRGVGPQVWDLATGAASGAAAVMFSMPFDTVKTYLQTHGADLSGRGFLGSAALFVKTGRRIAARKGLAGLYVGVTPRLFQQVPSAMVCWWSIAAFKRWMEPYTAPDEEDVAGGGHRAGKHAAH